MDRTVGIGYITTNTFNNGEASLTLPVDESVCGMLFDVSDFTNPFEQFPLIEDFFGKGDTVFINNLKEAENCGLTDTSFMNGVPAYHIKSYYDYLGYDAPLYVCFTDDSEEWNAIERMQMASGGKLFQIGVWTAKTIWETSNGSLHFTNLIGNLEAAAETVSGKVGDMALAPYPVSIILTPNTHFDNDYMSIFDIPDATKLECPKVSVCLVQDDTSAVRAIQQANPNNANVGCLGVLMACLTLAYAEESIGYVDKFNLNKNDNFDNAEVIVGQAHLSTHDLQLSGNLAALKGYIVPCEYKGKEAEVFFSNDPTCDDGDYSCISNNRIMHKVRRTVHSALIPYLNGNYLLDVSSGELNASSNSIIIDAIDNMLDSIMINNDGQRQIDGHTVTISKSSEILDTDAIDISISVGLVDSSQYINEKDTFEI